MVLKLMKFLQNNKDIRVASDYFSDKRKKEYLIMGIILSMAMVCMVILKFDVTMVISNTPKAIERFVTLYLPPKWIEINKLINAVVLTVMIAVSAGTIGSLCAYAASIAMSNQTGKITF